MLVMFLCVQISSCRPALSHRSFVVVLPAVLITRASLCVRVRMHEGCTQGRLTDRPPELHVLET
jgi:hypothetical protein